jgi:type IV pilus assembly protein PilE
MAHKTSGFTLIELMIAVAVVVILSAIAIPAYNSFVLKSARSDAMSALMDLRLQEETYRLKNPEYAVTLSSLGVDATTPNGKYDIAITAADAASFTATASPAAGTSQTSDDCGTFAIDQDGPDTSGSYADASCWKR